MTCRHLEVARYVCMYPKLQNYSLFLVMFCYNLFIFKILHSGWHGNSFGLNNRLLVSIRLELHTVGLTEMHATNWWAWRLPLLFVSRPFSLELPT
jgi:carbon starvation protein CstA